jgi:putative effector of murein hydrolase
MTLAIFSVLVTLGLYLLNKRLYRRFPVLVFSPVLLTPAVIILLLPLAAIPFDTYLADTHWLLWFLGPATVAFAVPIYLQRALIREHWLALGVGTVVGVAVAVTSSWLLGRAFKLPPEVAHSLLSRSVSTPFALEISEKLGGQNDMTALFVVFTGVAGILTGEFILAILPWRSSLSRGASYGATAHALGTVKAREFSEQTGVMASLLMIFSGLLMVVLVPWLSRLLG